MSSSGGGTLGKRQTDDSCYLLPSYAAGSADGCIGSAGASGSAASTGFSTPRVGADLRQRIKWPTSQWLWMVTQDDTCPFCMFLKDFRMCSSIKRKPLLVKSPSLCPTHLNIHCGRESQTKPLSHLSSLKNIRMSNKHKHKG